MDISFVRHTAVAIDGGATCYGNTDVPVADTFMQEAAILKTEIADLLPDAVFSSPLSRAAMLAEFVGKTPIIYDDRIKEMNFGDWEMKPWNTIIDTPDIPAFFNYYIDNKVPGGESLSDQRDRVKQFLDEQKSKGYKHILVFCHGGVINCARSIIENLPLQQAFAKLPPYASHTLLSY